MIEGFWVGTWILATIFVMGPRYSTHFDEMVVSISNLKLMVLNFNPDIQIPQADSTTRERDKTNLSMACCRS